MVTAQPPPAVHRTILVVDVEGFADRRRTNRNQVTVREGLHHGLREAFDKAGISWLACRWEDRGDAVLVLAPPEIPKALFVESLPHELVRALRAYNSAHAAEERIRLRMAVHAGEVNYDDYGVAAQSINLTFRLLDAQPLKAALAESPGVLVLIVSSWFFDEVVRHGAGGDGAAYRPVWVTVKETSTVAWICRPDHPYPPDDMRIVQARPAADMAGVSVVVPTGQLPTQVRGRDRLLLELHRALRERPGVAVVLTGMGGVGKSTIAAEFADRVQRARARTRVWWVSAVDRETLTGGLVSVARQLGAARADINAIGGNAPDAPDRLWALLNRARRGWLLVFDNVDEPNILGTDIGSVADGTGWLRPTSRGLVVITSRDSSPAVWGRHARIVAVAALDERAGAQVLLDRAPAAGDDEEARNLARRLGGLPLALRLVGSYLGSDLALRTSFRDYRDALDHPATRVPLLTSAPALDSVENARAVVMRTWEMSLDALDRRGVAAARPLLRLLSCYAWATPIPLWLLAPERLVPLLAGTRADAEQRLEYGLAQLKLLGLIDTRLHVADPRERGLVVHPVVADTNRSHLRDDQDGKVDAAQVRRTAAELLTGVLDRLDHENPADWGTFLVLGPHLHAVLETVARFLDRSRLDVLVAASARATRAHGLSGAIPASERLMRAALEAVAPLPDDDPIRLAVLQDLAWPIAYRGQVREAERIYRHVFAARRRVLGEDHPDTLRTHHEVAWIAAVQGRWVEAEKEYREVLQARRRVFGPEDRGTLMAWHELGWAIAHQSRFAEAESILLRVLDARQRLLGEVHPRTLKTFHELVWVTAAQGRWVEAETGYRTLLEQSLTVLGVEHPDVLTRRHELAWVLAAQGNHGTALTLYREVLDTRLRVLGDRHPDTIATRDALERLRRGEVVTAHHLA